MKFSAGKPDTQPFKIWLSMSRKKVGDNFLYSIHGAHPFALPGDWMGFLLEAIQQIK
jgi:hypothetical protein